MTRASQQLCASMIGLVCCCNLSMLAPSSKIAAVEPPAPAASSSSIEGKGPLRKLLGGLSSASPSAASPEKKPRPTPSKGQTLYERLLFFPAKHPLGGWQPQGLKFEDVNLTSSDGTKLNGWYCPCDNPRAVVLYCHGNGGNLSYDSGLYTLLQRDLRVAVCAIDYRGYGKSEGTPNVLGALEDARAARTWLAKRANIAETEIVLMGRSLGGAIAVQLAANANPRALVLESTFSTLKDAATHHFPNLAWLVPEGELNSVATLAACPVPLLQSHGDADRTIPFAQGEKLFQAAKGKKQFLRIPGGDHNDPQPTTYYQQLDRFLGELP